MARVKMDRFGQEYVNVSCKENKNGYPVGYIKLKGQLYKVEPSAADGEYTDRKGNPITHFVKLTRVKQQKRTSNW